MTARRARPPGERSGFSIQPLPAVASTSRALGSATAVHRPCVRLTASEPFRARTSMLDEEQGRGCPEDWLALTPGATYTMAASSLGDRWRLNSRSAQPGWSCSSPSCRRCWRAPLPARGDRHGPSQRDVAANAHPGPRRRRRRRGAGAARRVRAGGGAEAGRPTERDHDATARLRPQRAAQRLLRRPRRHHGGPVVQRAAAGQRADPAAVDGRPVVGGPGVERPGPVPRLERHPQQPAAALAGGRRPRVGLPRAVEQQQRQHVRLPGPAALVRAPDPARGALRERRLGHADRRLVQRQAAELAQRRRGAPRRLLLVHGSAVRRPVLRGRARRVGRAEQPRGPAQAAAGPAARHGRVQARAAARRLSRRSRAAGWTSC